MRVLLPVLLTAACSHPDEAACHDYVSVVNACVTRVETSLDVVIPTLHLDHALTCRELDPAEDAALFRCFIDAYDRVDCTTESDLDEASRALTACVIALDPPA